MLTSATFAHCIARCKQYFVMFVACCCLSTTAYSVVDHETEQERAFEESARHERIDHDVLRLADPKSGLIPHSAGQKDREFAQRFTARTQQKTSVLAQEQPLITFRNIGPSNVGGRTTAFAVDRNHANVMLAGGATGGIWRSIDAGSTWTRVSDQSDIQNVSCIVQDPVNSARWYAGTGEVLSTTDRRTSKNLRTILTGSGLYRSDDGGHHWQRMTPTLNPIPNSLRDPFQAIWRIVPTGDTIGDELYAACYGGIYRCRGGVFTKIAGDSLRPSFCTELALAADKTTLYAAYGADDQGQAGSMHGIWVSRDEDHQKWTNISPSDYPAHARRIVMATAPSNTSILYVFVQEPLDQGTRYTSFGSKHYLWKFNDANVGSSKWTSCQEWLDSLQINTLAGYAMCLAVHPRNDSAVFIAGTDLYRTRSAFRDVNDIRHLGGYPYTVEPGVLHPDLHCLFFSHTSPYALYAAGDGGTTYTENSLTTVLPLYWKTLNNGFNATQCYSVAQDEFDETDSLVCVSLQDNSNYVCFKPSLQKGWTFCYGGDGTCAQIVKGGSFVVASSQYAYSMYAFGFNQDGEAVPNQFSCPPEADKNTNLFVSLFRFVVRSATKDTILVAASGNHLYHYDAYSEPQYYNSDERHTWSEFSSVAATLPAGALITAMAASKTQANILYIGCSNGSVYKVLLDDAAGPPQKLGTAPVSGFVSSIDCDEAGYIVISYSNYAAPAVYLSSESLISWVDISDELRDGIGTDEWGPSVRCLRFYADRGAKKKFLLAGTSAGLFVCPFDQGKNGAWRQFAMSSVGSVIVESMSLRHSDGRLLLGTHGAGVYESVPSDDTNVVDSSATHFFSLEQSYPNPAKSGTFIRYYTSSDAPVRLELYDAQGALVRVLVNQTQAAGLHHVELGSEIFDSLSSGNYYYKLTSAGKSATRVLTFVR